MVFTVTFRSHRRGRYRPSVHVGRPAETACYQSSCDEPKLARHTRHAALLSTSTRFLLWLIHTSQYHRPRIRVNGTTAPPAVLNTASRPRNSTLWPLATNVGQKNHWLLPQRVSWRHLQFGGLRCCLLGVPGVRPTRNRIRLQSSVHTAVRSQVKAAIVRVQICMWCFAFQHRRVPEPTKRVVSVDQRC